MNRDMPEGTPPAGPRRPMSATRREAFEPLVDWMAKRANIDAGVSEHACGQCFDITRTNQRFITLQIDVDVRIDLSHDFGEAVCA